MAVISAANIMAGNVSIRLHACVDSVSQVQEFADTLDVADQLAIPPIMTYARLLEHCAQASAVIALVVLESFCLEYGIPALDIHIVVQQHGLDEGAAQAVLRAYFLLWNTSAARHCYFVPDKQTRPVLFEPTTTSLMAMFGGQPGTSLYLGEAKWLLNVYRPLLLDFVKCMSAFLSRESEDSRWTSQYEKGLDVFQWLSDADSIPDAEYLVSAPVSMPLAGFIQLMQIMVLCKTLGLAPGEFSQCFTVAAGHSQGIVVATAFSIMSDEESFDELSMRVLGTLLLTGALPQVEFPSCSGDDNSGDDTQVLPKTTRPMLSVRGLSRTSLEACVDEFNAEDPLADDHACLTIVNSYDQFIVSGHVAPMARFRQFLHSRSASSSEDQSKVPFAQRRPVISTSYIDITVPYHCRLLQDCVGAQCAIAQEKGWCLDAGDMQLPVRAADDGHDIRTEKNLTSGFGQLARRIVEGRGIPIICAGALVPRSSHETVGTKGELYKCQLSDVVSAPNWLAQFGPRLVRTAHDGKIHIDTRMRRILGTPTVMVAGMLPTTVNEKFVAAINNAGYHAELAGGGMHSESEMVRKVQALAESTESGKGITLNCIYINPRQWSFQFPKLLRLRSEGLPIAGLCIGGGVPSFDTALEIIGSLRSAGIRHVSFKPSTAEAIRHVIKVAQANDGFPIVLQWTGGRAGGHHSFEDFHQPILETYAAIRTCDNIALVAGSGFGDAAGTLPYITGDWSMEYGRAPMPFDGVMLGSRVMVAQEAGTSLAAKELIVAAEGLPNSDWHKAYDGAYGGTTTLTSEYGEFNHVLATRAAMFIRDMHATILNQPREKHEALLRARKDDIIARLNRDYMRPWFGKKADGRVVDLEDMTYAEVIDRLVELMYVKSQKRWIRPSHFQFVADFMCRVERRLDDKMPEFPIAAQMGDVRPKDYAPYIVDMYPEAATQLLASEDVQFFVGLCKRRGQKPPPFIPVLDIDFGTLFLKDTLWPSEDLDAVIDGDPQRVGIQQGPVAAQYSVTVDEPVKDILDGIYHGHIAELLDRLYDGDESRVPTVEYIGAAPLPVHLPDTVTIQESSAKRVMELPTNAESLPDLDSWLQAVAGPQKSWLRALLTTPTIVQSGRYVDNFVRRLMRPRPGQIVHIALDKGIPAYLSITGSANEEELSLVYDGYSVIRLTVHHQSLFATVVPFSLALGYVPAQVLTPIHGCKEQDNDAVRQFFVRVWLANSSRSTSFMDVANPDRPLRTAKLTITKEHSQALCKAIGNKNWHYAVSKGGVLCAPVEFTHISIIRETLALMCSTLFGAGSASIVQTHNRLEILDGVRPLSVGDVLHSTIAIDSLINRTAGKEMSITGSVYRGEEHVATLRIGLLGRLHFIDASQAFRRKRAQHVVITLPLEADVVGILSRDWFCCLDNAAVSLEPGAVVEFYLDSEYFYKHTDMYSSAMTTGTASIVRENNRRIPIATVDFKWGTCVHNPVIAYLNRYKIEPYTGMFEGSGYALTTKANAGQTQIAAPSSNWYYARQSLDGNPFHTNPYIADYADLQDMITHGLWTNASTRAIVERIAAGSQPERIRMYQTDFVDMVFPGDRLATELFHIGMRDGRILVTGQTSKVDGGVVMEVSAEVDQPLTAYVFTGQGAQEAGMGMDLYVQSPMAQAVWDRANAHMLSTYGISLLNIVRTNPAEHTVYFNGKAGKAIRDSYRSMAKQAENDASGQHPLLPGMSDKAMSYTFRSPTGLLNSTQFTQAALVTAAMASVTDLRSQGLVQKHALWGGHSLGEFAALAALGQVFSVEDILDVVFVRGLIMQSAVPRDAHGRSEYGMAAVNPSRVGPAFGEDMLRQVVDEIGTAGAGLLQVVNYNVQGQQYVVAGTLTSLEVLRLVLDGFAKDGVPTAGAIASYIKQAACAVKESPARISPTRGTATIPLDGIDVPFHSQLLLGGVDALRKTLQAKLASGRGAPLDALNGRYIPNLTATPFEVTEGYFRLVFRATQSPVVGKVLRSWDDTALDDSAEKAKLAALLLVELLAYQLASPVQWIATQKRLFGKADIERVVEIGPSPVLCAMAAKSLQSNPSKLKRTSLLHIVRDRETIYYEDRLGGDAGDTAATAPSQPEQPKEQPKEQLQEKPAEEPAADPQPVQVPTAQDSASTGTGGPIADVPLPALDVAHVVVAFKLKQSLGAISALKSIKALVGGKSTLQNEVVADLQKEFGSRMPDKPEEMALQELGAAIGTSDALGKCTQPLVARMFSSKMPGGFSLSSARSMLESAYGLGPQRQDALLLVALTMEPASRLSSDAEATAWLDKAARAYATKAAISYSRASGSAASGSQATGPVVSSAEMKKMQQQQSDFVRQQIEVLARYAGIDMRKEGRAAEAQQAAASGLQKSMDAVSAEFGDELISGVQPCFDARKARPFDSYWNWVRQDVFEWIQQAAAACIGGTDDPQPATVVSEAQILRIRNCADAELLEMLAGMATALSTSSHTFLEPARQLIQRLHKECQQALHTPPVYLELSRPMQPQTRISAEGKVSYAEVPRQNEHSFADYVEHMRAMGAEGTPPLLYLREKADNGQWEYDAPMSDLYFDGLAGICRDGQSWAGKMALVTGCGRGSIGAEVVRGLLMGGAKVLATTSSYSRKTTLFFEDMYKECGSRGSELIVVPFNQGSVQDIDSLVHYIFDQPSTGVAALGWDLDYVFPFAAISDIGSTSSNLGSWSELALRIMMTNLIRLLGSIKDAKESLGFRDRPSLVVLPLSPNHGTFGGDGLYGECKIALETVFNRWECEEWEGHLSVIGAVVGWTRGTSLTSNGNLIAQDVEAAGVRTFTSHEMALNVLGLLYPHVAFMADVRPVYADISAGLNRLSNTDGVMRRAYKSLDQKSKALGASAKESALSAAATRPLFYRYILERSDYSPLAKHLHHFPTIPPYDSLTHLHHLQDMINLDKVVVITGYGETGPYGNAETRWEMEAFGELSTEGCIELAWIMGLIRHHSGQLPATGEHYVGWVDAKSGEPVRDIDMRDRYEEFILAHTGIRLIEPAVSGGYDPETKHVLREVQIQHDMEPFEASAEDATAYKKSNGDKVDVWENSSGGSWSVRFLKGALVRVPMFISTTRLVAGMLPSGWDFARLGFPEDVIRQLDPVSLYTLVAVIEALVRSGITDPYELYRYFHVSEVGNTIGSAMGGGTAIRDMFLNSTLDREVGSDVMQETFVSTVQAWINMLLMSGAGPVKPVVGACATAAISIDTAVESIQTGKARVMLVGGVDDFSKESSTEFANMGATCSTVDEVASGRTPSEMCRPCTSTRKGLVEGQGASAAVLMSASAAIEYGAPIYGVVAMSATATDKQGRSVPAPGKGILTSTRGRGSNYNPRLLDLGYRKRKLQRQLQALDAWRQEELDELDNDLASGNLPKSELATQAKGVDRAYARQRRALRDTWGNEFWKQDSDISPLRGSLAVWGLTADDIGLASFHGTATKANDQNESDALNAQLQHLGRTPGHVLPAVCQKWLVGHTKAAAAGFGVNGIIQSLRTGIIPGNRNADNIDPKLRACDYSLYLSKTIQTPGIRAALLKSFGFGQVGAELLIIHPDYVLAAMGSEALGTYREKLDKCSAKSRRYWQDVLVGKHAFVQVKDKPPFTIEQEVGVYLDHQARVHYDPASQEYHF